MGPLDAAAPGSHIALSQGEPRQGAERLAARKRPGDPDDLIQITLAEGWHLTGLVSASRPLKGYRVR